MAARVTDLAHLRAVAFPLADSLSQLAVPEPVVKAALRELGVATPRAADAKDAGSLRGPIVLKAFGPGIVHKTDIGAVRLGLGAEDAPTAMRQMADHLASQGVAPASYMFEEQHGGHGTELVVGVVRRDAFGPVAVLGLGGTLTEHVDRTVVRLAPITEHDAHAMLDELDLPTREPTNRAAIVAVLLAVAGERGLVARLGSAVVELECNPVLATAHGAIALDARLIIDANDAPPDVAPPPRTDFAPLFAPSTVAVVGASTTKVTFGNRFLAAYRDAGWTDGLYAIHPSADQIDGVPAVASIADVPGGVDYVIVAVPAGRCAEVVAATAGHARFVQVISSGFGETGAEGSRLEAELLDAAHAANIRLLGPNCLGVFAPAGRQTFQLGAPRDAGTVAVISQSGGLAGDIVKVGDRRGVRFSKVVTVGNAIDVMPGELLELLLDDPDTTVVGLYLEGARDGRRLVDALRRAAGRRPVVLLAAGSTDQGEAAVVSHTGAMTGARDAWRAVAASTGTAIVDTLEDLLGTLAYFERYTATTTEGDADSVLVVGPGGGASVLATDACDRHGLRLAPVFVDVQRDLRALGFGAGTSVANPLEIPLGPATGPDAFARALDPVLDAQSFPDLLLHVNVQAYFSYGEGGAKPLLELLTRVGTDDRRGARTALVLRNFECAPAADAAVILDAALDARVPSFRTFDEAARAIAAAHHFDRFTALPRKS